MTGFQELLLILLLLAAIFLVPRMMSARKSGSSAATTHRKPAFSGPLRLAILVSFVWLAVLALATSPWQESGNLSLFLIAGLSPVVLCWGVGWVVKGFRKR